MDSWPSVPGPCALSEPVSVEVGTLVAGGVTTAPGVPGTSGTTISSNAATSWNEGFDAGHAVSSPAPSAPPLASDPVSVLMPFTAVTRVTPSTSLIAEIS